MDEENMTKSEEQQPLSLQKALQQCELVQNMIDLSISNLEGLRTKCATSNDLTQKEIRTLEAPSILRHCPCLLPERPNLFDASSPKLPSSAVFHRLEFRHSTASEMGQWAQVAE
ncbi:hypothetical protein CB1_000390004 [Camelus ferus]|nr:hypothetical protein CB1_000390004 [Camelus ferus]